MYISTLKKRSRQRQPWSNQEELSSFDLRSDSKGLHLYEAATSGPADITIDGTAQTVQFVGGKAHLDINPDRKGTLLFFNAEKTKMRMTHVSKTSDFLIYWNLGWSVHFGRIENRVAILLHNVIL